MNMLFREAFIGDITGLQQVRLSVKENRLSDPTLVTDADYINYLTKRGKGWLCEADGRAVGFAIIDLLEHNVWALFVHPAYEGQGIGTKLHGTMLDWHFAQTNKTVWLSTDPATRAAQFYSKAGWKRCGAYGKCEIRFELTYGDWIIMKKEIHH
jgi:GNAT superfamily N-acetyltransferase